MVVAGGNPQCDWAISVLYQIHCLLGYETVAHISVKIAFYYNMVSISFPIAFLYKYNTTNDKLFPTLNEREAVSV